MARKGRLPHALRNYARHPAPCSKRLPPIRDCASCSWQASSSFFHCCCSCSTICSDEIVPSFKFQVSSQSAWSLEPETWNLKLSMEYTQAEILQTVRMTEMEHLDIRTVTLGLSLRDCVSDSVETTAQRVREKIERTAERLVSTVNEIGDEIGIRIANKRIAVTPVP